MLYDGYSNYLTVQELENKSAREAIVKLQKTFGEVRHPTTFRADNSPCNSCDFREFTREYNMKLVYLRPRYPQSNGLAEKGLSIAKSIIKRAPAQLFFGRMLKTGIPVAESVLKRRWIGEEKTMKRIGVKIETQKQYYYRHAKDLQELVVGDRV